MSKIGEWPMKKTFLVSCLALALFASLDAPAHGAAAPFRVRVGFPQPSSCRCGSCRRKVRSRSGFELQKI
jgi:hypothetical protein